METNVYSVKDSDSKNTSTPWKLHFVKSPVVCQPARKQIDSGFESFVSGLETKVASGDNSLKKTCEENIQADSVREQESACDSISCEKTILLHKTYEGNTSTNVCSKICSQASDKFPVVKVWKPLVASYDSFILLDETIVVDDTSEEDSFKKCDENCANNLSGIFPLSETQKVVSSPICDAMKPTNVTNINLIILDEGKSEVKLNPTISEKNVLQATQNETLVTAGENPTSGLENNDNTQHNPAELKKLESGTSILAIDKHEASSKLDQLKSTVLKLDDTGKVECVKTNSGEIEKVKSDTGETGKIEYMKFDNEETRRIELMKSDNGVTVEIEKVKSDLEIAQVDSRQSDSRVSGNIELVKSDNLETGKSERVKSDSGDFVSSDPEENADNNNPEWELLKKLDTDEERYKAVRLRWRNLVIPNPNKNLTYRNRGYWTPDKKQKHIPEVKHKPVVMSRKRTHSADPPERHAPAKRQRTFSCTEVFDRKMLDIHKNLSRERNVILQQHEQAVQNLVDKTSYQLRSYPPGSVNDERIRALHVQNVVELRYKCDNRLAAVESESMNQLRTLEKAMEEVRVFNSFYQGLEEGSDDALLLTDEQLVEVLEEDHLYECFTEFYNG